MKRRRTRLGGWAFLFGVASGTCALSCGEDGVTPDCPELPLYDVRDPDALDDPEVARAREEAIAAGCLTDLGEAAPPSN